MRVIAGEARGRPLQGPKHAGTRPTSDLIRGAIFSMLEARGAVFDRVLDLFAGTGALGIEALSRGAAFAEFVERDRGVCRIIELNLDRTGLRSRGRVLCAPLPGALSRLAGPYQLIFADPPYGLADAAAVLDAVGAGALVEDESTIVYEHARRTMPPEACGRLPLVVTRAHGSTAVSLYYRQDAIAAAGYSDDADGGTSP
jgi:16S rRNA (guanine966-N2)-methyltransferase